MEGSGATEWRLPATEAGYACLCCIIVRRGGTGNLEITEQETKTTRWGFETSTAAAGAAPPVDGYENSKWFIRFDLDAGGE